MFRQSPEASENRLLSTLPREEYERLAPHLEPVSLALSEILFMPDDRLEHVYFPTTAVISLLTDLQDGSGVEVGLVGKEGMAGISVILGSVETKLATVQHSGAALRVKAGIVAEEFNRSEGLRSGLLRYMHALMAQISQSVVCNVRHKVEERFVRWILMHADRVGDDEFTLTQEFIANMLGVRRSGVTVAANNLQREGLIAYSRGHIKISDRAQLEEKVCECYHAVKAQFDGLYG